MITQFKKDGSSETRPERCDYANALDYVTWYNGLAEDVAKWINLEPKNGSIPCPNYYCGPENSECADYNQLQVLWMIAVVMFGDYGTSPRYGWITDIAAFRLWVSDITKTTRYAYDPDEESKNDQV